ncbi:MAG TPA: penicillin-binding transpeptidase domain-containing protein [Thermoanaerobaculia bacterium]|jgi:cell division protein FtsI (penicillin-binding protein 3)|nr:penicillin-binding transpeptidase domain-containing protein [Thermoanaerobaculia bacterium]
MRRLGRLGVVAGFGAVWVLLIAARLYHLQVARYGHYTGKAERQQQRVVTLDPPRGTIYDAHGRELAVSVQVDSAYAVPPEIHDATAVARALAGAVPGLDAAKLARQLGGDREFVWVARKLDPPVAARVRDLALPGIYFLPESKRYYPMGALAAQVLGYVGTDNHGLAGLELVYDREVAGKQGVRTVLRDAKHGTLVSPGLSFAEPEPGHDLYLTLDATVQHIVERELVRAVEARGAKRGSALFLDPKTGGVLAMASYPSFDPNDFGSYREAERRNRAIMDVYEPGSTFKIVTAAAALDSGLIKADDVFDCEMGGITLFGIHIRDHKRYGRLSFAEVIAKSSNVGVIKAALRLGDQRLYHTIRGFGFGRLTGIDLPGESGGILHPVERWGPLAKAYVAFGQGVSVTPLQLAAATAAVANGGTLLKPHVVAAVSRGELRVPRYPEPPVAGHPISTATAAELTRLLEGVVTGGTGKSAAIAGYRVAGKTGTAQIPVRGGYLHGSYLPSFVGYAPADRAALVGVVAIAEPQGGEYYGGQVAAPVFSSITRQVLLYLGVHPERQPLVAWPGQTAGQTILAGLATRTPAVAVPAALDEVPTDGDDHAEEAGPDPILWRGPVPAIPAATPPPAPSSGGGHL